MCYYAIQYMLIHVHVHAYLFLVYSCLGLIVHMYSCTVHVFTLFFSQVFFVVLLHPSANDLPATTDPDSLIACELMDGRDAFLNLAREKHWEFSSLRRAKYSSIAMLYELHNQGGDRFVYNCNGCSTDIEIRFHCKECEVCIMKCLFMYIVEKYLYMDACTVWSSLIHSSMYTCKCNCMYSTV